MSEDSPRSIDDFGVPVHVIEKRKNEQLRISINEYKGHQYIDIRSFFRTDEEFLPSRKGVTLKVDDYPELLNGVILLGQTLGFDLDDLEGEE